MVVVIVVGVERARCAGGVGEWLAAGVAVVAGPGRRLGLHGVMVLRTCVGGGLVLLLVSCRRQRGRRWYWWWNKPVGR